MELIVKTFAGLEGVLAEELKALGAEKMEPGNRAVHCQASRQVMYRINLEARTALRVLVPVARFKAKNEDQLYQEVKRMDWGDRLNLSKTFSIDAVTGGPLFKHSRYVALKAKDAIVDQFRETTGKRPDVDTENPDLRINLHIKYDKCTLSLDSSGDSLHRRGYRKKTVQAPINEVLAAGMLKLAGWPRPIPFLDPMTGSGTLAIEAAMMACQIPPQLPGRRFGFQQWPDFDSRTWDKVVQVARAGINKDWKHPIRASDRDYRAVEAAVVNARAAGVQHRVDIKKANWEQLNPGPPGLLIMNPPYDERLPMEHAVDAYKKIGDHFKQAYPGWEAWIISSHKEAVKHIGLRTSKRTTLFNGPLECKFLKYELYKGTNRAESLERS